MKGMKEMRNEKLKWRNEGMTFNMELCRTLIRRIVHTTFLHLSLTLLITHFSFLICNAQKVITRSTMIGVGPTKILDTYLSAEHFSGAGLSFISSVERHREKNKWSTLIEHEANISSVKDRSGKQQELEAAYNVYWGKLYNWQLLDNKLKLQAGGVANGLLGVIYNTTNSNNPAQARVHINIMPTAAAAYHFMLFHKKMMARYELSLPLCGIMFSPNYGQSYHEIFNRDNYDHNVVPTTFISAPEWRQMLTLDVQLSKSFTMRLGYLGNMQQSDVNHLKQHVYTHRFLVGITKRFSIVNLNEK